MIAFWPPLQAEFNGSICAGASQLVAAARGLTATPPATSLSADDATAYLLDYLKGVVNGTQQPANMVAVTSSTVANLKKGEGPAHCAMAQASRRAAIVCRSSAWLPLT